MRNMIQLSGLLILATVMSSAAPGLAEDVQQEFESYDELRAAVVDLWNDNKVDEAISSYHAGLQRFADHSFEITSSLINMNLSAGRFEACFELFEFGHEHGHYYPIYSESGPFADFLETPRFQAILERNQTLIAAAEKNTQKQLRVSVPNHNNADSKYPLMIVLHGWSGRIDQVARFWWPENSEHSSVVAYLQSSQIVGKGMFGWDDLERARQDVQEAYEELVTEYPVDRSRVVIAGFSQGGRVAIDAAVNKVIPVAGFVVHCPGGGLTKSISVDGVRFAAQRGLRGTILTGKIDHSRAEQEQLVELFKKGKLIHRYETIPELGHWYPEDFAIHLDAAISHIFTAENHPQ